MKSKTYKYTSKGTQKSFRLKEADIFVFTFFILQKASYYTTNYSAL